MGFLDNLFGTSHSEEELIQLIKDGAVLVDVRNPDEFAAGSVTGAINIPVDRIQQQASKLEKNDTIIVFCRTGNRSAQAKRLLEQKGFKKVINGGVWEEVQELKGQI